MGSCVVSGVLTVLLVVYIFASVCVLLNLTDQHNVVVSRSA